MQPQHIRRSCLLSCSSPHPPASPTSAAPQPVLELSLAFLTLHSTGDLPCSALIHHSLLCDNSRSLFKLLSNADFDSMAVDWLISRYVCCNKASFRLYLGFHSTYGKRNRNPFFPSPIHKRLHTEMQKTTARNLNQCHTLLSLFSLELCIWSQSVQSESHPLECIGFCVVP